MLKSMFTKYFTTLMSLLALGFLAIAIIVSSVLTGYSKDTKSGLMYNTAETIYNTINSEIKSGGLDFSETILQNSDEYRQFFATLANYTDSILIITDNNGNILLKSGKNSSLLVTSNAISHNIISSITENSEDLGTLDGMFDKRRFNYIYPVNNQNGILQGMIIFSCESNGLAGSFDRIIYIVLIASAWVFIASMVAVYFIADRIVTPLKKMSQAAQMYSKGDFDVRVPVKGSDEIASLAKAFNQMAQSLQNLENTRSTFLSNVSHDLRTPMTSIQGFIEGILDGTIPYEKQNYYLDIVSQEVKRLSRLVNSLLDISRMEAGKLKITKSEFDVCEIARIVLISFEEKIDKKRINIEFDNDNDPSTVYADKDAIHQIVYNLTDNAIKFTDEGGTIKISVRDSGDKYIVSVYNTGIGIKSEELDYIFDRFYKTDSSRGLDKTGTGLGLYIAKTKIEAHGEKITVNSEYGKYIEFAFSLEKRVSFGA